MSAAATALKPRKSPVQARSTATVQTLHVAAIQVLTQEGLSRCTTTRIAERAGMSVGSLYQYYPNRDALLAAVLEKHLDDRPARQDQPHHRRNGDERNDSQRVRQRALQRGEVLLRGVPGHHRQNRGAYRDRIAAEHQFHDAIGDAQRKQRSVGHDRPREEHGVHREVDVGHADADDPRQHQLGHAANAGM